MGLEGQVQQVQQRVPEVSGSTLPRGWPSRKRKAQVECRAKRLVFDFDFDFDFVLVLVAVR